MLRFFPILSGSSSKYLTVIAIIVTMGAAIGISRVVGENEALAFYAIFGVAVFIFAFLNTDFALSVLILSMLLSPEFSIGGAGGAGQMAQRGVVVRIDDLLLGLIMLSWLVKTAVNKEIGIIVRSPLNRPIFYYIVASLFATVLGIFLGNVRPLIGILYNIKYFQYFLIYFMVLSHVQDLATLKKFVKLLLITSVIVSIYALAQIPSGVRVSAPFEGEGGEANTLGGYLIVIMSMVAGIMTGFKKKSHIATLALALGLMLIPFAFTLSRSSWVSLFPALVALLIYSNRRRYILGALMISLIILPAVMPGAVYERIEYTFAMENTLRDDVVKVGDTSLDPSTSERIQSWSSTLAQWTERPIFGWGVTGAGFKDAQYFRVLVETGVIGFGLFIALLVSIHRTAVRNLKQIDVNKYPSYHGLIVGFIAGFWGLLMHSVGANTFIIVRVMEPFWFLTGLMVVLPSLIAKEEEEGVLQPVESVKWKKKFQRRFR
ncbi:MAG: O-antigen ligase family protein [Candidatus Electryonea clarkiae]|nr:O-antigen ligase family protein [Candidatus Electryonea clarkiae]MDP8288964.1 O-antigen ligase family protein [Candidatus Electryonea clarkiae]